MTKPLHGSQKKISTDETGFTFSIEMIPNHELEELILSFEEGLKVIVSFFLNSIKLRLANIQTLSRNCEILRLHVPVISSAPNTTD